MADETPKGPRRRLTAEQHRAIAEDALDAVLAGHVERARVGSVDSAMVVVRALAEHAKIFGYALPPQTGPAQVDPVRVEISVLGKDKAP